MTFEWAIILFAVGIAIYFALPFEPNFWVLAGSLGCVGIVGWIVSVRFFDGGDANPIWIISLVGAGCLWATINTHLTNPNPLAYEQRLDVTGVVIGIDNRPPMRRLEIKVYDLERVPETGRPDRLRIRVGRNFPDIALGDALKLPVVAKPLPGPVVPNGYDPARRAFFDGLAGSGYAIADPEFTAVSVGLRDRLSLRVAKTRYDLARHILERAPEKTAGLQAALLTGIRDYIPEEHTDALRASGLAHILAISGLHMGMVAFGVFAGLSFCLAAIEPYARSRDVRKPAAIVAMILATLYLLLSGASVATQRAYIMVMIAFLAVILDRRAISMRSVAVAALITLIIRPEALLSVGFQMSFAAVAALVAAYRLWQDRKQGFSAKDWRSRFFGFYGSLAMTSTIAGFATAGFALFHFGRVANYGLLGNLAAMSVFPLVMATGLFSVILIPIGLDGLALALMGQLINFMLVVAEWVAGLPGALGYVKSTHPLALAFYGLGFAMSCLGLCLMTKRSAIVGVTLMAVAALIWLFSPKDDIRINQDGRVSILRDNEALTSSLRADRYGRERFAQALGDPDLVWEDYRDKQASCDALACRLTVKETVLSIIDAPSEVPEACENSDIVILPDRRAGSVARRGCEALLIDSRTLADTGGLHIRLGQHAKLRPLITQTRQNRPWG